jgi:hypothetical protein
MSEPPEITGFADDATTWINPPPDTEKARQKRRDQKPKPNGPDTALVTALTVQAWRDLPLPTVRRLLGDVVTDAARVFLVGATGIGKTLFAYAIAAALATGRQFLHWSCDGPARVLTVDGEMSSRMIKKRSHFLLRHQPDVPPGNLLIYSLQRADEFAARFPQLGKPAPLNTDEGREWLLRLIDLVQPDVVILDNVMSLIAGVMKEEEPWQQTLPLVLGITALGKAQIWLDHTGHNSDRQYGTSTKGWFFDVIGVMLRPNGEQQREHETCFDLSFDPPTGKARNRDPDRWNDFAPHHIRLTDEGWTSEPIDRPGPRKDKVKPSVRLFHDALLDALAVAATNPGETTRVAWEGECIRRGLIEGFDPADDGRTKSAKRSVFRAARSDLLAARMIGIDGDRVMDLTRAW